jgi:hypothetical protein
VDRPLPLAVRTWYRRPSRTVRIWRKGCLGWAFGATVSAVDGNGVLGADPAGGSTHGSAVLDEGLRVAVGCDGVIGVSARTGGPIATIATITAALKKRLII